MSLKDKREVILMAFNKALDECIAREAEGVPGKPEVSLGEPVRFDAVLTAKYSNGLEIVCHPAMAFPGDTPPA